MGGTFPWVLDLVRRRKWAEHLCPSCWFLTADAMWPAALSSYCRALHHDRLYLHSTSPRQPFLPLLLPGVCHSNKNSSGHCWTPQSSVLRDLHGHLLTAHGHLTLLQGLLFKTQTQEQHSWSVPPFLECTLYTEHCWVEELWFRKIILLLFSCFPTTQDQS